MIAHVRADGRTVTLRGDATSHWHLEVRGRDGALVEMPQEWIAEHGHAARVVFARRCAEPIALPAELVAELRALARRIRLKPGEAAALDRGVAEGRATTLRALVDPWASRKHSGDVATLVRALKDVERAAVEALPVYLRVDAGKLLAAIAARFGAELEDQRLQYLEEEGGDEVHFVNLTRRPNRWRETWTLASTNGPTPAAARFALAADLTTGDAGSPCLLCREPGAFVGLAAHAIDERHPSAGRVLAPRTTLCAVCLGAAVSVEGRS